MDISVNTIYKDESLIVVNKPAGVLSHPNPRAPKDPTAEARGASCIFQGTYHFADRRFDTPNGPVWLIHRLDRDTSGVLLAAFDRPTAERLRKQFDHQDVDKRYVAIVGGEIGGKGVWRDRILKQKGPARVRSRIVKKGIGEPNAVLDYVARRYFKRTNATLVEFHLVTGRTHQIRVQAASKEHPVAGDAVYGHFGWNRELRSRLGLKRIFLHASGIALRHPTSGKVLHAKSPLPEELERVLSRMS